MNRKGQIASGLTWFVAMLIIFFMLVLFLAAGFGLMKLRGESSIKLGLVNSGEEGFSSFSNEEIELIFEEDRGFVTARYVERKISFSDVLILYKQEEIDFDDFQISIEKHLINKYDEQVCLFLYDNSHPDLKNLPDMPLQTNLISMNIYEPSKKRMSSLPFAEVSQSFLDLRNYPNGIERRRLQDLGVTNFDNAYVKSGKIKKFKFAYTKDGKVEVLNLRFLLGKC
tara:strand:+ start:722 stop:1399 length:678 start_codon:yes stop_codon:yes gene_type:complete